MDLPGVEVVAAGEGYLVLKVFLVVCAGLFNVSKHKVGLAHDAGHVRLAVFGDLMEKVFAEVHHILVVFLVEAALKDVVIREGLEAVVLGGKEEPLRRILEIALGVVDVAEDVVGRGRIVVPAEAPCPYQQAFSPLPFTYAVSAVAKLVGEFGLLTFIKVLHGNAVEPLEGFFVPSCVKKVQAVGVPHLRCQDVLREPQEEVVGKGIGVVRAHCKGAEGPPAHGLRGREFLHCGRCLRIHSGIIEGPHLGPVLGMRPR